MKTGLPVPGINTEGVFFVEEDQHNICERVKEYDPNARLVTDRSDQMRLGIAVHVTDNRWAPGGAWVIAFWANDQKTGEVICGEADGRILELQKDFDTRAREHPARAAHRVRMALMLRELRKAQEQREVTGEIAEKSVHRWQKARGVKRKIYVPASVNAA